MNNVFVIILLIIILLLTVYLTYSKNAAVVVEPFTATKSRTYYIDDSSSKEVCCERERKESNTCFPAEQGAVGEGGPGCNPSATQVGDLFDTPMKAYHITNEVYYPRYRGWWSHVKDLQTRPPYNRIYPPYWNTYWDPNITSDVYYSRVAADNIMPSPKASDQIAAAHRKNFDLRQQLRFGL